MAVYDNCIMDEPDGAHALPCADKIAFDDKKDAQAAATVARYNHGSKLHVYLCKYCGLWHIASGTSDE